MLFSGRSEDGAMVAAGSSSSTSINCPFCSSSDAQFLPAAGRPASQGAGFQFPPKESITSTKKLWWPNWVTLSITQYGVSTTNRWFWSPCAFFIFYFFGKRLQDSVAGAWGGREGVGRATLGRGAFGVRPILWTS